MLLFAKSCFTTSIKRPKPLTGAKRDWMDRHVNDPFVKAARLVNSIMCLLIFIQRAYRSRAAFKLMEIDEKYKLLKSGMLVIDVGAAPGGWS